MNGAVVSFAKAVGTVLQSNAELLFAVALPASGDSVGDSEATPVVWLQVTTRQSAVAFAEGLYKAMNETLS